MTQVVNLKHVRADRAFVYIGRGSPWGNPFRIGEHGTRDEVIEKYRRWLPTQKHLMAALPMLRGRVLACFCKPEPCHGDILVELIENLSGPQA